MTRAIGDHEPHDQLIDRGDANVVVRGRGVRRGAVERVVHAERHIEVLPALAIEVGTELEALAARAAETREVRDVGVQIRPGRLSYV